MNQNTQPESLNQHQQEPVDPQGIKNGLRRRILSAPTLDHAVDIARENYDIEFCTAYELKQELYKTVDALDFDTTTYKASFFSAQEFLDMLKLGAPYVCYHVALVNAAADGDDDDWYIDVVDTDQCPIRTPQDIIDFIERYELDPI